MSNNVKRSGVLRHKGVTPRGSMVLGKTNTCYDKCERIVQTKCPTNDNCNVKVAYSYSSEVCVKEKGKLISLIWFCVFDKSGFV